MTDLKTFCFPWSSAVQHDKDGCLYCKGNKLKPLTQIFIYILNTVIQKQASGLDTLNGLIQKINSMKPKGTSEPNDSIPKITAKRVISAGLIAINYSPIIPADQSNYTVLLIYFSLFEDYIHKKRRRRSQLIWI